MKKILSLVLVLSLVLGTFSFAFADGHLPEDIIGEDSEKAVATLMALGVVDGYDDGTYKPEKAVTRAEMAKLLVEALGYGELAAGATATFSDAQGHWAESYIGFAASMDLVLGYPDGTFKPNQVMSMDEAMTMVIRALGYTDEVLKGTWPTNYKVKALDLGLTANLSTLSGEGLRGNVAILLYNALDTKLVEVIKDANGLYSYDYIEIDSSTDKKLIDQIGDKVNDEKIDYVDVFGDDALPTAIDLEKYLFHTIDYYENADGEVAYVANIDTDELEGIVTATTSNGITVKDAENEKTAFVTSGTSLFLNGDKASGTITSNLVTGSSVKVVYSLDTNDAKVVEGTVAWQYELIDMSNTYNQRTPLKLTRTSSYNLPAMLDSDDNEVLDEANLVIEGVVDSLEDIEKEDLVYYYASDTEGDVSGYPAKVKLMVVRDTFKGTLTEVDEADSTAIVNGEVFEDSEYDNQKTIVTTAALGNTLELRLDKDGDVYDWTEESSPAEGNYAIFIGIADGTTTIDEFTGDVTVNTTPRVKLLTSNGDMVIYDIETDTLSDATTGFTANGSVTINSILGLSLSGTAIDVTTASGLDVQELVEYSLNSDGELDDILVSNEQTLSGAAYDVDTNLLANSFDLVSDTIVFDVSNSDKDKWEVSDELALGETVTGSYIADSSYNLDIVVVTDSDADTLDDGDYAIITDYVAYYDGSSTVQKVTLFEGGVEKTYITDDSNDVTDAALDVTTSNALIVQELTLDGDILESVAVPTTNVTTTTAVEVVNGNLRVSGGTIEDLSDDVVVYYVDADGTTVVELDDVYEDDLVILVNVDGDSSNVYEIVIVDAR